MDGLANRPVLCASPSRMRKGGRLRGTSWGWLVSTSSIGLTVKDGFNSFFFEKV